MTIILLLVLGCSFFQAFGIKLHFESFEQSLGQEYFRFDLRVRKYNRTTTVLNGTVHMLQETDNSYIFTFDMFYSRLGNQQFNHLPIKLPTAGLCEAINNVHKSYPNTVKRFINTPKPNECPVAPREIHVYDMEFPDEVWPSGLLRNGLWKAVIRGSLRGSEIIKYSIIAKAVE